MPVGQFPIGFKAAIICDGKLLILKRREDDWRGGEWDFPGGAMDEGETPIESLQREILEEAGLNAEIVKPLRVWSMENEHGTQTVGVTFLASSNSNKDLKLSDEHSEYRWIDQSEMKELILPDWLEIEANLAFIENSIL
jgi:8-oxo-dGTP diphosphatase